MLKALAHTQSSSTNAMVRACCKRNFMRDRSNPAVPTGNVARRRPVAVPPVWRLLLTWVEQWARNEYAAGRDPGVKLLPYHWSLHLAWLTLAVLLAVCLPLFLCMPPETDITFYDLSARNILRGGVHYRDAFDTNLPGMVWLHAVVRATLGWSSESLRAVDFAVVAAIT